MNDTVKLIGICGPARAGKDTFARNIAGAVMESNNPDYQDWVIAMESFASPIKSMVAMLLDFSGYCDIMNPSTVAPFLDGDRKEEVLDRIGKSPRELMQTLGTDWGRKMIDDDIWLNNLKNRITQYGEVAKHGHQGAFVLVTDVRFDNEAEMIKHAGGTIVKITTDRETDDVVSHESEGGVSDCLIDTVIENNGELEEFELQATSYINGYLGVTLYDMSEVQEVIHIPTEEDVDEAHRPSSST